MRLTEKTDSGSWCLRDVPWSELKPGVVLTERTWRKIYGALMKLKDYEDAGKSPDEIKSMDDDMQVTAKGMLKKVAELSAEIDRMKTEGFWIPATEKRPEADKWVYATIKIHRWISDYGVGWVLPVDMDEHPEHDIVALARYQASSGWQYIDPDDGLICQVAETGSIVEDLSYPVAELTAWAERPEPYKAGR